MNKSIIIRDAIVEDAPFILELIKELAIFEKDPDAVIIDEAYLIKEGFGKTPAFKVFIAELNTKIVGMALFYPRFSTWKGKTLHLEDLIVKQDKRNLGIGKALYTHFLHYAAQQKVKRVEWVVLNWNTNAINFYKKSGANVLTDWQIVQMNEQQINQFVKKNSI